MASPLPARDESQKVGLREDCVAPRRACRVCSRVLCRGAQAGLQQQRPCNSTLQQHSVESESRPAAPAKQPAAAPCNSTLRHYLPRAAKWEAHPRKCPRSSAFLTTLLISLSVPTCPFPNLLGVFQLVLYSLDSHTAGVFSNRGTRAK